MPTTNLDLYKQFNRHMVFLEKSSFSKTEKANYMIRLMAVINALSVNKSALFDEQETINDVFNQTKRQLFHLEYQVDNPIMMNRVADTVLNLYKPFSFRYRYGAGVARLLPTYRYFIRKKRLINQAVMKRIFVESYVYGSLYFYELTSKMSSNKRLFDQKKNQLIDEAKRIYEEQLKNYENMVNFVFLSSEQLNDLS